MRATGASSAEKQASGSQHCDTLHLRSARSVNPSWPTFEAVALGLVGGAAQVLNYEVIPADRHLHAAIGVGIYFLLSAGVPPLTGVRFAAVFHLPGWASGVISAGMGALLLLLTTVDLAPLWHEIVAAIITVLSAWGFSARVVAVGMRL